MDIKKNLVTEPENVKNDILTPENVRQHIKKYELDQKYRENIVRPLSAFKGYIDDYISKPSNQRTRIGLVICHGHNHSIEIFRKIKFINHWYLVDANWFAYPDYICDAVDKKAMEYFPDKFFDCVLIVYCPQKFEKKLQYFAILDNVKPKIRSDGFIISTELPHLFFWYADDHDLTILTDQLIKFIRENDSNKHDFDTYVEKYEKQYTDQPDFSNAQNRYLMVSAYCDYHYPNLIDIAREKQTKKILKNHGYKFIKQIGAYLFIH